MTSLTGAWQWDHWQQDVCTCPGEFSEWSLQEHCNNNNNNKKTDMNTSVFCVCMYTPVSIKLPNRDTGIFNDFRPQTINGYAPPHTVNHTSPWYSNPTTTYRSSWYRTPDDKNCKCTRQEISHAFLIRCIQTQRYTPTCTHRNKHPLVGTIIVS